MNQQSSSGSNAFHISCSDDSLKTNVREVKTNYLPAYSKNEDIVSENRGQKILLELLSRHRHRDVLKTVTTSYSENFHKIVFVELVDSLIEIGVDVTGDDQVKSGNSSSSKQPEAQKSFFRSSPLLLLCVIPFRVVVRRREGGGMWRDWNTSLTSFLFSLSRSL